MSCDVHGSDSRIAAVRIATLVRIVNHAKQSVLFCSVPEANPSSEQFGRPGGQENCDYRGG